MKKMTRLLALFTAFALLCLSATGCNAIDEMRDNHAVYTKDGNIRLRGTEYIVLPANNYFSPYGSEEVDAIQVTQSDVPVLLSVFLGTTGTLYNDGMILSTDWGEQYYCRQDEYDEIAALLAKEFEPTGYCYTYQVFDVDTYTYNEHNYLLTEAQEQAINEVLDTIDGIARAESPYFGADQQVSLYACSDNMLLSKETVFIEKHGDCYYLVDYSYNGNNGIEYAVPTTYDNVFDAIMEKAVEAQKSEEAYYEDFYDYEEDEYDIDYEVV